MKKINVLFLMLSLEVGGTEKHVYELISNINKEKFRTVVCCLYDLGSIGRSLMNENNETTCYYNIISHKYDISGILHLISIIKKENIDVLYTINSPLTLFIGALIAKLIGLNACVTRDSVTNPIFHVKRRRIVNRLMLPFVDRIVAQSDSHAEYLINSEGMNKEKIEVIYNSVKLEQFIEPVNAVALKDELHIPKDVPVVGIVGRLAPEKGHVVFLQAARKILNKFPQTQFIIVGDGSEMNNLQNLTEELGIQSNVIFLGVRRDIPWILSLFDVAVLSSHSMVETVSNAVLEYMAAGKPVVATNAGSTSDLVSDKKTGVIIPCGDSEAMTEAVLNLFANIELMKKMGDAGREKVKEKFTIHRMVAEYETLFARLIK